MTIHSQKDTQIYLDTNVPGHHAFQLELEATLIISQRSSILPIHPAFPLTLRHAPHTVYARPKISHSKSEPLFHRKVTQLCVFVLRWAVSREIPVDKDRQTNQIVRRSHSFVHISQDKDNICCLCAEKIGHLRLFSHSSVLSTFLE